MMKSLIKPALAAGIALAAISSPAAAQVNGMATFRPALVIALSQARQAAYQAIGTQYATQIAQIDQLGTQRATLLRGLDTNGNGQFEELDTNGNGTLDDQQRKFIAVELDGQFDQMMALANSRDAMGNFIFSGYQVGVTPFVKTAGGASFQGDAGERILQVDASREVKISTSGEKLFEYIDTGTAAAPGSVQSIFQTLRDMSTALKTATTTPAAQAALASQTTSTGNALTTLFDRVLSARAAIGAQQKEIDALDIAGSARDLEYTAAKSGLQDVDYNKAISQFSQQQTTLEAALKSYKAVTQLSLFSLM